MHRAILVLNAAILVVTFVVALTAGDVQGQLLSTAVRTAGNEPRSRRHDSRATLTLVRVVQSMDGYYTASAGCELTPEQLASLRDAIELYSTDIDLAVAQVEADPGEGDLRVALERTVRGVRLDLEAALARSFSDPTVCKRIATEIIRHSR